MAHSVPTFGTLFNIYALKRRFVKKTCVCRLKQWDRPHMKHPSQRACPTVSSPRYPFHFFIIPDETGPGSSIKAGAASASANCSIHGLCNHAARFLLVGSAVIVLATAQRTAARRTRSLVHTRPFALHQLEPVGMIDKTAVIHSPVPGPQCIDLNTFSPHTEGMLPSPFFVSFCFHHLFPLK